MSVHIYCSLSSGNANKASHVSTLVPSLFSQVCIGYSTKTAKQSELLRVQVRASCQTEGLEQG